MSLRVTEWQSCYDEGWGRGLLVPAAFSHPAKFSCGLIRRIVEHGLERGYLRKGDLVGDPFAGVACGGIIAASYGLRWIGVELEKTFVDLGQQNIALHRRTWETMGDPVPVLIQGDSRNFASLIAGQVGAICTSPPYAESISAKSDGIDWTKCSDGKGGMRDFSVEPGQKIRLHMGKEYGCTRGQIGAMKSGELGAVLTSPPYAESDPSASHAQGTSRMDPASANYRPVALREKEKRDKARQYGRTEGQIGQLPQGDLAGIVQGIVSSPPFLDPAHGRAKASETYFDQVGGIRKHCGGEGDFSERNIYQAKSDDNYWSAVRDVYTQCLLALRPGGVIILVVKAFVKQGRIIDLPSQTLELLTHLGFEPLERIHAMLTKTTRHQSLFGGEHVKETKRVSFFRRLAESKGSPKIDFETVLICRKPEP